MIERSFVLVLPRSLCVFTGGRRVISLAELCCSSDVVTLSRIMVGQCRQLLSLLSTCDHLIDSQNCALICLQQNYSNTASGCLILLNWDKYPCIVKLRDRQSNQDRLYMRVFIRDRDREHKDPYQQSVKLYCFTGTSHGVRNSSMLGIYQRIQVGRIRKLMSLVQTEVIPYQHWSDPVTSCGLTVTVRSLVHP